MPKVFSWNGFRFHFYSDEGHPREPKRINVERGDQTRLRKVAA